MPEHINDHDLLIRLDERTRSMDGKLDKLTDDHEKRLRSLERWRWISTGMGTAGGTLISQLIDAFKN